MEYGLIGSKLTHSFSKYLHETFLNTNYELKSLDINELDTFFKERDFKGINVTLPYKKEVIKYLDEVSDLVKRTGTCNVIINENNKLKGYNTDYFGFKFLIEENDIIIENRKIAILGSGGTFSTLKALMEDLNAKEIYCISREKKENTYTYDELYDLGIDVLINATPVGMYPNNYESNIDLDKFNDLKVVIDVIFNPLRTKLILDAKKRGIKAVGGLEMLVAQGVKSSELFLNQVYSIEEIRSIYFDINVNKFNIVLIGMPMSGKSTLGKMLASAFNKEFIDIDKEIVEKENMTINEIFNKYGEAYFRKIEKELYKEYAKRNGLIISTGGGIVKSIESIDRLKENGMIIFIDRKVEKMIFNNNRPLSKTKEEVVKLYNERYNLYLNHSDKRITNNGSKKRAVIYMVEAFYEYISH